eukprot:961961-Pelagomonas_calceolata.AAC.1
MPCMICKFRGGGEEVVQKASPIRNARHAVMPRIGKREKLPLDKKHVSKVPNKPAVDITQDEAHVLFNCTDEH